MTMTTYRLIDKAIAQKCGWSGITEVDTSPDKSGNWIYVGVNLYTGITLPEPIPPYCFVNFEMSSARKGGFEALCASMDIDMSLYRDEDGNWLTGADE